MEPLFPAHSREDIIRQKSLIEWNFGRLQEHDPEFRLTFFISGNGWNLHTFWHKDEPDPRLECRARVDCGTHETFDSFWKRILQRLDQPW